MSGRRIMTSAKNMTNSLEIVESSPNRQRTFCFYLFTIQELLKITLN